MNRDEVRKKETKGANCADRGQCYGRYSAGAMEKKTRSKSKSQREQWLSNQDWRRERGANARIVARREPLIDSRRHGVHGHITGFLKYGRGPEYKDVESSGERARWAPSTSVSACPTSAKFNEPSGSYRTIFQALREEECPPSFRHRRGATTKSTTATNIFRSEILPSRH